MAVGGKGARPADWPGARPYVWGCCGLAGVLRFVVRVCCGSFCGCVAGRCAGVLRVVVRVLWVVVRVLWGRAVLLRGLSVSVRVVVLW